MKRSRTRELNRMCRLVHGHARYKCGLCGAHIRGKRLLGGFMERVYVTGFTEHVPVCRYCVCDLEEDENGREYRNQRKNSSTFPKC